MLCAFLTHCPSFLRQDLSQYLELTDPFCWTGWIPLCPPVLEPSAGVTDMGHSVELYMVAEDHILCLYSQDFTTEALFQLQLCSSSALCP